MSGNPDLADLQRWSEEVAKNPASLSFLPLARAYRRQGQREAAMRVCLRALEQYPTHVEGHALVAVLHLESGDRERACDEWATVLRLDPKNFEANRGMGFAALERSDLGAARRHLEQAAAARPGDPAVRDALGLLRQRIDGPVAVAPARERGVAPAMAGDPGRLFEFLLGEVAFLGALVLDSRGLVLAGTLVVGGEGRAESLGAVVGGVIEQATRLLEHLAFDSWNGILLETDAAILHIAPLGGDLAVLVAATPDAPTGWMLRTAARAADRAREFIGGGP